MTSYSELRLATLRATFDEILMEFQCVETMLMGATRGNTEENILKSTGENAMLEEFLRNVSLEEQTDIADGKPTGAKELAAAVVVSTSAVGKFPCYQVELRERSQKSRG